MAILGVGNGERPIVAVAAHAADEFFLGHNFEHADQIGDEPGLAGDGSGIAGGLVLIVVHENDAVGIRGDALEIAVAGGYGGVDIEPEIAGAHVLIERLDEAQVGGTVFVGDAFNIEREAAIDGIRGEKAHDLLAKRGAFGGIL